MKKKAVLDVRHKSLRSLKIAKCGRFVGAIFLAQLSSCQAWCARFAGAWYELSSVDYTSQGGLVWHAPRRGGHKT